MNVVVKPSKIRLLVLIALLSIPLLLTAQLQTSYTVIKVSGKVVSKILNKELVSGDIVRPDDRLIFDSKDTYIHVINAEGTKTIRNVPDSSPRELMQLMGTFLSPNKNKSTRGVENSKYYKIKSVLKEDTILILGNGYISIDTAEITLQKPAGVKAKYLLNNNRVSLTVSTETGYFLGKENLFNEDERMDHYPKVTVVYYENIGDQIHSVSVLLGSFIPFYPDEPALQKEVKIIIKTLKDSNQSNDLIIKEINNYLMSAYAAPITENVTSWLDEHKLLD